MAKLDPPPAPPEMQTVVSFLDDIYDVLVDIRGELRAIREAAEKSE
jgi:hypothetical protein